MGKILSSNCNDILEFGFETFFSYYNMLNGKTVNIAKQDIDYKDLIFKNNNFFEIRPKNAGFPKVVIGINISSNCNLRCKYCFSKEKANLKTDLNTAKAFIEFIVNTKKETEVFFVDMAGSGEPLLYLKEVLEISDFCRSVSDRIGKEVTPMLSTNGLMLDSMTVKILQKHNILFGISLDGYKELHDYNRLDALGRPTYERIVSNIMNLSFNEYVGGSMTITSSNTDIFKAYINMLNLFKTVAIRPCRMSYTDFSFSKISEGYKKFSDYLIKETLKDNLSPVKGILNGEDFYGKYILKIISNSQLERRCDAGCARFALSFDGKIFPCSPAIYHSELEITEEKIKNSENNRYFTDVPEKCGNCIAKNICGSDCFVLLYKNSDQISLCEFKRFLFILALKFCGTMEMKSLDIYCKIVELANKILWRSYKDKELETVYKKYKGKISFTELKKIKDHDYFSFTSMKNK